MEGVPISDLCDERGLQPTVFYRWQKEFFENGAAAFNKGDAPTIGLKKNESPIWSRRSRRKMRFWLN